MRLILALLLACSGHSAEILNLKLQTNTADSSGNGYDFANVGSVLNPILGGYSMFGPFSDTPQELTSNAAGLMTALSGISTYTISMKIALRIDQSGQSVIFRLTDAGNYYISYENTNRLDWATAGGTLATPANSFYPGTIYYVKFVAAGVSSKKIYINGVEVASAANSPLTGTITAARIGRYTSNGIPWVGYVSDFLITDTADSSTPSNLSGNNINTVFKLQQFGHSIAAWDGYCSTAAGLLGQTMLNKFAAKGRPNVEFTANRSTGTTKAYNTDGYSGRTTTLIQARFNGLLKWGTPKPSISTGILLGPMMTNDAAAAVATSVVRANIDAMIATATAYSADMPIFLVTDILRQDAVDIVPYNDEMREAYDVAKAAGKKVFLIDLETLAAATCDNIHPTAANVLLIGNLMANSVMTQYLDIAFPLRGMKLRQTMRMP